MIKYESFKNSTSPQIQFIFGSKNDKCLSKKTNAGEQQIFYFSPLLLSLAEFGTPKYIKYIEFRAEFFCGILITTNLDHCCAVFLKFFMTIFATLNYGITGTTLDFFSHIRELTRIGMDNKIFNLRQEEPVKRAPVQWAWAAWHASTVTQFKVMVC